jgi:hypothetical protein
MSTFRPKLTYANVMSSIAVFAVLGGGAYAGIDRKIRTADLGKNVVTTPKLAKQAVGTGKVKAQAIRRGKINDGAVRRPKIFDNAVNADKIENEAVTTDKIANQAVTTDRIAGEAVETDKLAPAAVQHGKIADGAVLEQKLADEAVTRDKIANGEVTKPKLANTYLEAVAGARATLGAGNVDAGTCVTRNLSNAVFLLARDIVVVSPATTGPLGSSNLPNGISVSGIRGSQQIGALFLPRPAVRLCNVTGAAIAIGGSVIDWEVLRR